MVQGGPGHRSRRARAWRRAGGQRSARAGMSGAARHTDPRASKTIGGRSLGGTLSGWAIHKVGTRS
eukprot:4366463-Alexandrium_andersonii.AAC.1